MQIVKVVVRALAVSATLCAVQVQAVTPAEQLGGYTAQAGSVAQAARGQEFFTSKHGKDWSCSSCHTINPTVEGKHASTGKVINPMAIAFNPDRFTDATFAYQGSGRGFDLRVLQQLETWVQETSHGLRQPDVTVWFELDPAIAAVRLAGARVPDRFEAQPVEFFQKVSDGYAARAHSDAQRFVRLDAAQTREAVWQQLHQNFVQRGWLSTRAT